MEHCWESIPDQPDISVIYSCDYKSNGTLLGIDPRPAVHEAGSAMSTILPMAWMSISLDILYMISSFQFNHILTSTS